ncbi:MAG TPA: WD40 repeat domain-containing protein, partial [Anaerolineales bacterium]|nr:WD40 repeat domain-containing protein [Anaerolineales bacterium]
REWQRLREWLNEDRDGLKLHRHLTETVREWESHGRDRSELYRGARLAHAREWIIVHGDRLNPSERDFLAVAIEQEQHDALEREAQHQRELEAAQKLAETERRSASSLRIRNRVIMAVGSITLILAIMTGLFGIQSNQNAQQAQKNLILAEQQRNAALNAQATADASFTRAESQRLAVEATNLLKNNVSPELIALLSLRSINMQYSPQSDAALAGAAGLNYPRQIFTGHTDAVTNLDFSPDGRYIVTGSSDQTARLWDAQTGEQIHQFDYYPAAIYHTENILVKFSPDGQYVLTIKDTDAYVASIGLLWDTKTGEKLLSFRDDAGVVSAIFSRDGKQLITTTPGGYIKVWDIQTGKVLRQSHFPSQSILILSASGKYVITKSYDNPMVIQVWDLEKEPITKKQEFVNVAGIFGVPQSVAISPDDQYALIGYVNGSVILWDIPTGKITQTFAGLSSEVRSVAFSPDGNYVIAGGLDKIARVWSMQTADEILRLTNSASIYAVDFSPDGSSVLTGSADGTVQLWAVHPRPAPPILRDRPDKMGLSGIAYSPDGKFLATGGTNGLQVWEASTGSLQHTFVDSGFIKYGVRFSPDSLYLLSGDWSSGVASLWDVRTGERLRQFVSP